MVEMIVTVTGGKEVLERLRKLDVDLNNMAVPFKASGEALTKFYSTVPFASRGSIYGTAWPALTPDYAKRKAEKWGGGRPILVGDGTLAKSFTYKSSKDELKIWNSSEDLFKWHQLGMGNNPQRVMMLFDNARQRIVTGIVEKYVKEKVENG